ncbi:ABC transporter ATP-binding protein [Candidatus Pacearchaeota archaeon]|nr:ABC transporter ATP-binding protein [Candidatus Pacearchaeota archaeon]
MEPKPSPVPLKERLAAVRLALKWTYNASKPLTILIFAIALLSGVLTLVEPYIFKLIIDEVTGSISLSLGQRIGLSLIGILIIYGIARVAQGLFWDIQTALKSLHSQKMDKYITGLLMQKISSLDAAYFENPQYYNTITKANQSVWRINDFSWQFTFIMGEAISVLVIIGALFTFNWLVVALVILAALPSILLAFKSSQIEWGIFDAYSPVSRHAHYYRGLMTDRPDAIKEIKLFGLQRYFLDKFESLFGDFVQKQERVARKRMLLFSLITILEGVFSVIAAWLVVNAFVKGSITIGELTFFWALLFQFAGHARWIVRLSSTLNEHALFISPFVKILAFAPLVKQSEHALIFPKKLQKGIEFRNVSFTYPHAKKPVLKNVSFTIKPGESIALVGENGSGKTTLIKLLTRLYDVSSGEILIDGVNIKEYSKESLYENIGIIFQDFMKYESLVKENIGFGNVAEMHRKAEVHGASVKSGSWDFIKALDKQYETHVGKTLKDDGTELSVGQWQKMALARAFFKNAQILCLDEPTAAVDARAEYELFRKFEKLTKDTATILISHRFSTVRMAHKILVMEHGKIAEHGTHRELMNRRGIYAKMFRMQAEGYR